MCWVGLHSNEEAPSTRRQADGGSLWTSSNQHGRETPRRSHESHEQHSGDAGRYQSTVQAEQGARHATNDVLITVDSLYVKGLIEKKFVVSRVLATLLRHMWKVTKKRIRLHIGWIHKRRGRTPSQIAWQMLARARNYSITCFDGHRE